MKRFILSALVIPALALGQSYNIQFEPRANLPEKTIRWVVVRDVSAFCQIKTKLSSTTKILACSEYNDTQCIIYTGPLTDMAQVGHEIRHCFEGQWHR